MSGYENFWWPGDGEAVHGAGVFNLVIFSYYALMDLFYNFVSGCENFWWPGDGEAVHGAGVLMCLLFMLCFD